MSEIEWINQPDAIEPGVACIIGMGAIGGSIAASLVASGWTVSGLDRDADGNEPDVSPGTPAGDELATADLIIVATPLDATVGWAQRLASVANPQALVFDVSGAKRAVVAAFAAATQDEGSAPLMIGAHPMAGTHVSGLDGARADLLDGATWVLTPIGGPRDEQAISRAAAVVGALRGHPVVMSAAQHDAYAARVSHLPFLNGLALLAIGSAGPAEIGGSGFTSATRVAASGNVQMWTEVLSSNADEVARAVDEMMVGLQQIRDLVDNPEQLTRVIRAIRVAALRHGDRPAG